MLERKASQDQITERGPPAGIEEARLTCWQAGVLEFLQKLNLFLFFFLVQVLSVQNVTRASHQIVHASLWRHSCILEYFSAIADKSVNALFHSKAAD